MIQFGRRAVYERHEVGPMLSGLANPDLGGALFAHVLSLQFEAVCAVHETFQHDVGDRGIPGGRFRASWGRGSGTSQAPTKTDALNRTEPPRVYRGRFGLDQATIASSFSCS
jgi:hypothetical protein